MTNAPSRLGHDVGLCPALFESRLRSYLRVSTDKQADRGVSLDAQRAKLKAYAQLYELNLVEIIKRLGDQK